MLKPALILIADIIYIILCRKYKAYKHVHPNAYYTHIHTYIHTYICVCARARNIVYSYEEHERLMKYKFEKFAIFEMSNGCTESVHNHTCRFTQRSHFPTYKVY